jgi:hypothetical protein
MVPSVPSILLLVASIAPTTQKQATSPPISISPPALGLYWVQCPLHVLCVHPRYINLHLDRHLLLRHPSVSLLPQLLLRPRHQRLHKHPPQSPHPIKRLRHQFPHHHIQHPVLKHHHRYTYPTFHALHPPPLSTSPSCLSLHTHSWSAVLLIRDSRASGRGGHTHTYAVPGKWSSFPFAILEMMLVGAGIGAYTES